MYKTEIVKDTSRVKREEVCCVCGDVLFVPVKVVEKGIRDHRSSMPGVPFRVAYYCPRHTKHNPFHAFAVFSNPEL